MATGPVGVTVMAIAGLVTGIIALYKNWDTVSHYLMQTWRVLTALVLKAVEMQLAALEKLIGWVPKVGTAVQSALQKVKDLQTSTWESIGNSQLEYEKKKNEQSVRNAQETEQKKAAVMVSTNAAAMEQVKTDTDAAHTELKTKHEGFWAYVYEASSQYSMNTTKYVSDVYSNLQSNLATSFQDLFAQIGNGWKGLTDIAVNFTRAMYNSLTQILANLAAEEIKNIIAVQIAQRAAAKANIAASAAEAGAKAAASSAGWALWGAVAIGAGILAAVLAFADGFAEGGIVGGNSFTGDKVLTRVNSGEMILNEAQQARLFAIADGRESAGNGGSVTINQNITVQNGNDIEAITQAIKRGSIEALEMANVAYKAGQKQNKYVG